MSAQRTSLLFLALGACEPPAPSSPEWAASGRTGEPARGLELVPEPSEPTTTGDFRCSPLTRIVADDLAPGDQFGSSVSISGDTVLVGAPKHDALGEQSGAAYVFVRSSSGWAQEAKLLAPDGAAFTNFGHAVALDGDTAIVGAHEGGGVSLPGSAYVFVRSGGIWSLQAQFTGERAGSEFGVAVALEGDTVLVGAPTEEPVQQGVVHAFVRSDETWTEEAQIRPPGPPTFWFGSALALRDNQAIVGLHDSAHTSYVFARFADGWAHTGTLLPDDALENPDFFGIGVDIEGGTAIVGDPGDPGVTYVYERTPLSWLRTAALLADDGPELTFFGASVALLGDLMAVGGTGTDGAGAVFLFVRAEGEWTKAGKLSPDGTEDERFGCSMSMDGSSLAIGAFRRNDVAGAAYVVACGAREALALACPPPLALECASPGGALGDGPLMAAWRNEAVVTGGCPVVVVTDDAPEVLAASCEEDPEPITVTFSASDACGQIAVCTSTVTVLDRIAPALDLSLAQACLWSPNHQFADVGLLVVADACDPAPAVSIAVCSDEAPASELGAGGPEHCPDARLLDGSIQLRAERAGSSGSDDGRVYTRVAATAQDACGNAVSRELPRGTMPGCPGVACVVHDQDRGGNGFCAAIEDAASWDATSCAPESVCR